MHSFLKQQVQHLDDNIGLRDVDRGVPDLGEADAVDERIYPKRPQDARPLALRRGAVDVRDS